ILKLKKYRSTTIRKVSAATMPTKIAAISSMVSMKRSIRLRGTRWLLLDSAVPENFSRALSSPLPQGEVGVRSTPGEGFRPIESPRPPHPSPLPVGEREFAADVANVSIHNDHRKQFNTTR